MVFISTVNPLAKIVPRIQSHKLSQNFLPQFRKSQPYPFVPSAARKNLQKISCRKEKEEKTLTDDEMLSGELSLEIQKLSSQMVQREEALEKSMEILFAEVCDFAGLKSEDLEKKWRRMNDDERRVLAKGFVAEWSDHFHPLSAKSVTEMVGEYLGKKKMMKKSNGSSGQPVSSGGLFPDLGKMLGFSGNSEE